MKRTFVIGDVHGHIDRLEALLKKANLPDPDTEIVQLGDLGHFGYSTQKGDRACYELARDMKMTVLWGNHDLAVFNPAHAFRGYHKPKLAVINLVFSVSPHYTLARHGYLMTHAGVHPYFMGDYTKTEAERLGFTAENVASGLVTPEAQRRFGTIDSIAKLRGGLQQRGGILWRDEREPLWDGMKQVYGHTRAGLIRRHGDSFCIDVAGIKDGNLAGLWLSEKPEEIKFVAIGPDADMIEQGARQLLEA